MNVLRTLILLLFPCFQDNMTRADAVLSFNFILLAEKYFLFVGSSMQLLHVCSLSEFALLFLISYIQFDCSPFDVVTSLIFQ